MTSAVRLAVKQGSPAWLDARRSLVTATDIPVLLGLSPYKCEADLAAEKAGNSETESTLRMRIGSALQDLIGQEYAASTGRRLRRFTGLLQHPTISWAGASPDFGVVGERRLVEAKWTGSRSRFADGLPDDVAAQVAWQLMVADYPVCDVAVLVNGDELRTFTVERDREMEQGLVEIAQDFRARLAAGGPFAESADSLKRRYPHDTGAELVADEELDAAAVALLQMRAQRKALEAQEEAIETAIKTRMADAAVLQGSSWRATWKRTKDTVTTDWRLVADGLLRQLAETDRAAIVGLHSVDRQGFRPFRIGWTKED